MNWENEKKIIVELVQKNELNQAINDMQLTGRMESMPCAMCQCMPSW